MAKERIQKNRLDFKVTIFWIAILAVTVLFAILFAMRIHDTRIFDSYDDLAQAKLNLVYDIYSEEGEYFVYVYSAKKDGSGNLVDTSKTDFVKANEVLPTVFNYFNYVRRNERALGDQAGFCKIYGYNVKNSKDGVLTGLGLKLEQLPALVRVANGTPTEILTKAGEIQKALDSQRTGK